MIGTEQTIKKRESFIPNENSCTAKQNIKITPKKNVINMNKS